MKQLQQLKEVMISAQVAGNGKVWTMMTVMAIVLRIVLNGDPGGAWGG